jgi:probable rRNA maturation factor
MKDISSIEILNLQKIKKVNLQKLRVAVNRILAILGLPDEKISLVFCDNVFIINLNKKIFRLKNPTDVISFPMAGDFDMGYLGEVVVSVEEAVVRAKDYGNTWEKELMLYIIHGILHLIGYDDITKIKKNKMDKKQQEILTKLELDYD